MIVTEALSLKAPLLDATEPQHAILKASARPVVYETSATKGPAFRLPPQGVRGTPSQWQGNRDCPDDIGWAPMGGVPGAIDMEAGWPFMIGQTAWHLGSKDQYMAWCGRYIV